MIERLKKAIDTFWVRSKAFRPTVEVAFFVLANGTLSYYCFMRGEREIATVLAVLFLASIAAFVHSVYKLSQKKTVEIVWNWIIFASLALVLLLIGVVSENVVTILFATFLLSATMSSFLTSYVRSDHMVKRALEVVFLFMTFGVVIYGYVITRSLILGIILLFAAVLFFVAFVLSYLLPKIHSKPKNCGVDVKNEGQEKGNFAYDVGTELGREIRKGLEENWKSHVIAGVITVGCGLFLVLLKIKWYFIIMLVFISYHAVYSALSNLFENKGVRAKK